MPQLKVCLPARLEKLFVISFRSDCTNLYFALLGKLQSKMFLYRELNLILTYIRWLCRYNWSEREKEGGTHHSQLPSLQLEKIRNAKLPKNATGSLFIISKHLNILKFSRDLNLLNYLLTRDTKWKSDERKIVIRSALSSLIAIMYYLPTPATSPS